MRLVYATRRSQLALAQSRAFVCELKAALPAGAEFEELQVVTTGDRIQDRPLAEIGGKGLFVKEIEEALLDGRAHFAVHSIKDVPAILPDGLAIVCVPVREDPRDAIVAPRHGALSALPKGARVGTSSLRRALSLRRARPDLEIVSMRGNVDTRLRKVDAGECDAIVLACAGLARLGLQGRITDHLPGVPAIGQGALGIEARASDVATRRALALLNHAETETCVGAERGVLVALEGDCKTPIAAHARREGDRLVLSAFVADGGGGNLREGADAMPFPDHPGEAYAMGHALGTRLLEMVGSPS